MNSELAQIILQSWLGTKNILEREKMKIETENAKKETENKVIFKDTDLSLKLPLGLEISSDTSP